MSQNLLRAIRFVPVCLFGLYAWTTFVLLGLLALLAMILAPGLKLRRAIGWVCATLWLRLAFISVEVRGAERLPEGPAVVVANHSSYVDGVLLKAVLPTRFTFVIKKEMVRVPFAGLLLRRIGAEFVDRYNRHSGAMDARRILRAANSGASLVFFPEGTFTGRPGLARFHGGAFTIAARTGAPVVPIAIHGARQILRGDSLWPRPGRVLIEVLTCIPSEQRDASYLRDQCRAHILLALDEPDLLQDSVVSPVTQTE
jgi:1-acyl-sn-glycerol-3-phosphate acyltransferase